MRNVMLIFCFVLFGCASNQVKQLDTEIDVKGTSDLGTIGLKDRVAIIQKQTNADDELRALQWQNNQMEDKLTSEWYSLKRCRTDMADPRLGGNGEIVAVPEIDNMKQASDVAEEFGLNEKGSLQFVTREDFMKRIQVERDFGVTLSHMFKTVRDAKEQCELKMGMARIKAGLPEQRVQGISKYDADGNIVKTVQANENSVDDAFKLAKH